MAQPIPFTNQQASGVEALAGAGVISMNVVADPSGAVTRRPGMRMYSEAPETAVNAAGIEGLFCTDDGMLLAMSTGPGRVLYEVQGGSAREVQSSLPGTKRPVFAQTEMIVAVAGGREIIKYVRATRGAELLGGSPPLASHVIAHNSRLLANDLIINLTAVRYSDIANGNTSYAGLEDWSFAPPAGYIIAQARPDNVVAVHENTNNVFVFGTSTVQIYGPDTSSNVSSVYLAEATREYGCGAPYSIIKQDQAFAWLDQYMRFVVSDGRSYKVISDPISKTLDTVTNPSDCYGYRVLTGNTDCLVWTFPTDGRTFVYQAGSGWGQWGGFDPATTGYTRLPILSHYLRQDTNLNIVGTTDGYIGELSADALTDFGDPIRAHIETGYVSRGTDQKKHCKCVRMVFRRGTTTGATGPQAWLSYRDEPGPWEPPIPIDLGASADTHPVLEFRSLGTYRRRQWRFEFNGTDELVLVSATEDFHVLEQ
jgi:hypothetical protein